jgi:hypothetical protein
MMNLKGSGRKRMWLNQGSIPTFACRAVLFLSVGITP